MEQKGLFPAPELKWRPESGKVAVMSAENTGDSVVSFSLCTLWGLLATGSYYYSDQEGRA